MIEEQTSSTAALDSGRLGEMLGKSECSARAYGAALMIRLQTVKGRTMLNGALARHNPDDRAVRLVLRSVRFPSDAGRFGRGPGFSRCLL
jgi:hypothetical protein